MNTGNINIVIAEPSFIIYEGLMSILSSQSGKRFNILRAEDLQSVQELQQRSKVDIVLLNPVLIQNQTKAFHNIKKEMAGTHWLGIINMLYDQQTTSLFDGIITINEAPAAIIRMVEKVLETNTHQDQQDQQADVLSDREIEVLKLLVAGHSNKEIADKLFISTHTVITHRKNISQKTGIKSASGLTIYAVINNIVSIDKFTD